MLTFVFVTFLLEIVSVNPQNKVGQELLWSYDDESKWPGKLCRLGGRRQSPIDIRTDNVVRDFTKKYIKYGPLKFTGYHKVLATGVNNGHTIQFSTEGEDMMHPLVTGGPLKHRYRLEQLHFHWLSEHSINGIKYPMEIHFVHVRADLTVNQALHRKDGLAIISVFVNVQSEIDEHEPQLAEVMAYLPKLMKIGNRISGVLLDMSKLLEIDKNSYYTYSGSLTSPECNEAVIWIIFSTPVYMTDTQYRTFSKVGVGRHNFRSLQKQHEHVVYMPAKTKVKVPHIVQFFVDAGKVFTDFFTNIGTFMANGITVR